MSALAVTIQSDRSRLLYFLPRTIVARRLDAGIQYAPVFAKATEGRPASRLVSAPASAISEAKPL
jgi:hypothetical protein